MPVDAVAAASHVEQSGTGPVVTNKADPLRHEHAGSGDRPEPQTLSDTRNEEQQPDGRQYPGEADRHSLKRLDVVLGFSAPRSRW